LTAFPLATLMGLEPTTSCVTGRRSNQLSYSATPIFWCSARLSIDFSPTACMSVAAPFLDYPYVFACRATEAAPDLAQALETRDK
jgi:hypothetical protein